MRQKSLKILAIDDKLDNLVTIRAVIREVLPNAEVFTELNGIDGIKRAKTEDPDVILLDVLMPEMDGFEVCEALKKDRVMQVIPVIFLTALTTDKAVRLKAIEKGAESFLKKPIDEIELLTQILAMAKIKAAKLAQIDEQDRLEILVAQRTFDIEKEMTERKKSEEKYKAIFEQSPLGISLSDTATGNLLNVNARYAEIVGRSVNELQEMSCDKFTHPDDIEVDKYQLQKIKDGKLRTYNINKRFIKPCGEVVWVNMTVVNTKISSVKPSHLCMIDDITSLLKAKEEIDFVNYHDHLTGAYNRRFYDEQVLRLDSLEFIPLTLVLADVNGLKLTNDAFGHKVGDEMLKRVAEIFKTECRKDDIVARIGGDEFVMLLPKTDVIYADKIILRINEAIAKEKVNSIALSVSLGFAVKSSQFDEMTDVFKRAEDEMYRHKLSESSSMRSKTIDLIMSTLYEKSKREMSHSKRVSEYSEAIAKHMNFSHDDISQIRIAGLMHDIGKIGIDENILNKAGTLNNEEWSEIIKHPEIGYRILSSVNEFSLIAEDILSHHERFDGTGYPKRLKGEQISLQARIISVADTYDAMTSNRSYKKAISKEDAIQELIRCSGTQFDPTITSIFVEKVLKSNSNSNIS